MTAFEQFSEFGGVVQQCVLPLVVKIDEMIQPIGTGFVVNPDGLFITAAHVLEEAYKFAVRRKRDDGTYYDHYEFYAIYVSNEPLPESDSTVGGLVPINFIWSPKDLDIGFGWLNLPRRVSDNTLLSLNPVCIRPAIPKIGEKINAIGYYEMDGAIRQGDIPNIDYQHKTAISKGVIVEIHPEYRDKGMLSFPCFRTDARFEHGMSGGPIFNEFGYVCGVVCSSSDTPESGDFTSYGSLIWPIFGCHIDIALDGNPMPKKTLLYDLATKGLIKTDDTFNRVYVETADSGECTVKISMTNDEGAV